MSKCSDFAPNTGAATDPEDDLDGAVLQALVLMAGILANPRPIGPELIRAWVLVLRAAGVEHRRIYDLRHTYASWSLAAGVDIFTLARRMGTSGKMIDRTYGHLALDSEDAIRARLDARASRDGVEVASGESGGTDGSAAIPHQ